MQGTFLVDCGTVWFNVWSRRRLTGVCVIMESSQLCGVVKRVVSMCGEERKNIPDIEARGVNPRKLNGRLRKPTHSIQAHDKRRVQSVEHGLGALVWSHNPKCMSSI